MKNWRWRLSTNILLYFENGTRYGQVTMKDERDLSNVPFPMILSDPLTKISRSRYFGRHITRRPLNGTQYS